MIGMIRFDYRGGIAEAVLGIDGRWSCDAVPCLVHPLDILHSPRWDGQPPERRHLEEAACWLKGAVVFGDIGPIPAMAPAPVAGVQADPFDRRSRDLTLRSTKRSARVTDRAAAAMCCVGLRMIHLWVETGAWPIPRRGGEAASTFELSEVEGWLATGVWPAGAHFLAPPEDSASPSSRGQADKTSRGSGSHQGKPGPPSGCQASYASSGTFQ
jgi:hypothetical protein